MDLQGYLPTVFLLEEVLGYSSSRAAQVMDQYSAEIIERSDNEARAAAQVKHVMKDATDEEIDTIVTKATKFKRFGINTDKLEQGDLTTTPAPAPVPYDEERG